MVIDSTVWLEILRDGPLSKKCQRLLDTGNIRIPTLVLFEVYKKLKQRGLEDMSMEVVSSLSQYEVLDLSREVAVLAGDISLEYGLAMADAIVLAHAIQIGDELVTLDNDFASVPGARVLRDQ